MFKEYLYTFCGKRKVTPSYSYEPGRGGFCCDVVVPGMTFVGHGVAKSKKEAQGVAAKDFCEQLVKFKIVSPSSLPGLIDTPRGDISSALLPLPPASKHVVTPTVPFPIVLPNATPRSATPTVPPTQSAMVSPHDSKYGNMHIQCICNYFYYYRGCYGKSPTSRKAGVEAKA